MKERLEDLWWWLEDHMRVILIALVIIGASVLGYFMVKADSGDEVAPNSPEELQSLEQMSTELKEQFSLLELTPQSVNDGNLIFKVSLFMKQPFMTTDEVRQALEKYVQAMKLKYNDDGEDVYITGLQFDLYDRKILFDEQLKPRVTAYYMLHDLDIDEDDERLTYESLTSLTWQETLKQSGEPNYEEDYQFKMGAYNELNINSTAVPLSDEEFEFFLKLNKYKALKGYLPGAASLYLAWDLGEVVSRDGNSLIVKEFTEFAKRQEELGGEMDYYDYVEGLKQELAVENPQFLLFAETEKVVDSRTEAQKQLIEFNPSLYADVVKKDIAERAAELEEELTNE